VVQSQNCLDKSKSMKPTSAARTRIATPKYLPLYLAEFSIASTIATTRIFSLT